MNNFSTKSIYVALLLSSSLIVSCGGGGGGSSGVTFDGNTSPAAVDATNAESIGTASGESVQKAAASSTSGLPSAISTGSTIDVKQLNNIILSTVDILTLPVAADVPGVCDSGSASISDIPSTSGPASFTITYSNCEIVGSTFDGKVIFDFDDIGDPNAGFTFSYINFTVTDPSGETTTINMVVDCTGRFNCTFNSDFVGEDGVTHRISGFSISGDATSGYSGGATFSHGTHGSVSITFTAITYGGSCGVAPNGGSISFNSSDGSSGTIIFNSDCTVSGTWDDGAGASGSF